MTSYDSLKKTEETNKRIDAQIEHAFGKKNTIREDREKEAADLRQKLLERYTKKKTNTIDKGR